MSGNLAVNLPGKDQQIATVDRDLEFHSVFHFFFVKHNYILSCLYYFVLEAERTLDL